MTPLPEISGYGCGKLLDFDQTASDGEPVYTCGQIDQRDGEPCLCTHCGGIYSLFADRVFGEDDGPQQPPQ